MPLSYRQTKRILLDMDFVLDRQRGSHAQWKLNTTIVTVPVHDEYPIKTAKSIIQQIAKATQQDYKNLITQYNIKL